MLTKLCYEFGLLWTETGNIGIETTDRTVLRTALEPDLGVGTHTRRKMLPQLWGETHVDRDGAELSAEQVREQLVKIGVEKFGPLLRLIRKAGIAETRERTGLDTIRVTRGMTLEADIAQRVGIVAGKEKIVVATLPDTGLGQASLASTSPKARPLYGTSPRDGHVNIVLIADVPLEKFMGLSGIGYSDGHYIEHDCPVGVLDAHTVTVVATDVHDDAGREKFENLLDHLFTAPDPHLAARQHVKQGEQPSREPIRVNIRRPARTFGTPAPAIG